MSHREHTHRTRYSLYGWVVYEASTGKIVFGETGRGQPRDYAACKFEQARLEEFPESMTIGDGPIGDRAAKLREAFDGVPEPGTDIYVGSTLYMSHGADDFIGGLVEVVAVVPGTSAGETVPFLEIAERPGYRYNWHSLRDKQKELGSRFGDRRGHPDPDDRPEFQCHDRRGVGDSVTEKAKDKAGQEVKEREQMAGRVLWHIGENWPEPLDWAFIVSYVPAIQGTESEAGYRIRAEKEGTTGFEIRIGARKARSYWEIDKAIEKLWIRAANG